MEKLAKLCARTGTLLVIDECFSEMVSGNMEVSFEKRVSAYPNVIILKAFTKSFSIPGIRLGYCLCSDTGAASGVECLGARTDGRGGCAGKGREPCRYA